MILNFYAKRELVPWNSKRSYVVNQNKNLFLYTRGGSWEYLQNMQVGKTPIKVIFSLLSIFSIVKGQKKITLGDRGGKYLITKYFSKKKTFQKSDKKVDSTFYFTWLFHASFSVATIFEKTFVDFFTF